jgi:predicted deacylase
VIIELMQRPSRIIATIDLDREGKQAGFLSLPHSTHESAYGRIQIPIVAVRRGTGPTILLVAGNHGDEYEGQIALCRLVRELAVEQVAGRIILLPALNLPAAEAGLRTSPVDGGNLNRAFPGDPDGGPTAMIAHYVESILLPMADYVIDLHSGGSSLVYMPCALARDSGSKQRIQNTFAMLEAFGAPLAYITDGRNGGADRTLHAAADRCGAIVITVELGGGGTVDQGCLRLAESGVRRVLRRIGVWSSEVEPASPTRFTHVEGLDYYTFAPEPGVFEPAADLGSEVARGQIAGWVHFPDTPWREPTPVQFHQNGVVICKRSPGRARRGDCLYQVAKDYGGILSTPPPSSRITSERVAGSGLPGLRGPGLPGLRHGIGITGTRTYFPFLIGCRGSTGGVESEWGFENWGNRYVSR